MVVTAFFFRYSLNTTFHTKLQQEGTSILGRMLGKRKGILLSLLSSMSVGGAYLCSKSMLNRTNVETSTALWFLFSTILFTLFFLCSGNLGGFKTILKNYRSLVPLSLITSFAVLLWFYGTEQTEATDVAFMLQFIRVFSIVFGIVLLGERSSKCEGVGILLAVIGAITFAYRGDGTNFVNTIILLGSAFCYAIASLLAKIYIERMDVPSLAGGRSMFVLLFVSAYTILVGRMQTDISINVFILAFLGAFMAPFLGYLLFYKSLSLLEISKAMAVRCSDPLFTLIYSFIAFSSTPTINQLAGGTLIIVGVLMLSLAKRGRGDISRGRLVRSVNKRRYRTLENPPRQSARHDRLNWLCA